MTATGVCGHRKCGRPLSGNPFEAITYSIYGVTFCSYECMMAAEARMRSILDEKGHTSFQFWSVMAAFGVVSVWLTAALIRQVGWFEAACWIGGFSLVALSVGVLVCWGCEDAGKAVDEESA